MTAIQEIPLKTISGGDASLADHAGKVLLIVNVASKCGLTPQYTALEATYEKYREQGFEVLGFPANDFGAQEPGTESEIAEFCTTNFGVAFPMFSKIAVGGEERHALYEELIAVMPKALEKTPDFREKLEQYGVTRKSESDVLWNFEKFLVSRDGKVTGRFSPDITPDDPLIDDAIRAELAK